MSTRYNTGNPIESTDVRDMSDNAKNLDLFSNSSDMAFDDRFGVERKTIHGMNSEFNSQILNMGFTRIGTFASGATLTNPRQTLLWDIAGGGDGQEYGWSGSFLPSGKVVPPGSTPLTTGGIAVGAWMSRFDPELRVQVREALRRSYAEAGYNLVDGSFEVGGALMDVSDCLLYEADGVAYTWGGSLPRVIPAGATPETSGGISTDAWAPQSGALAKRFIRASTTVSEIASGYWKVGEKVAVVDRAGAPFDIVTADGHTPNGLDVLAAGSGKVATLLKETVLYLEYFGVTEVPEDQSGKINAAIEYAEINDIPSISVKYIKNCYLASEILFKPVLTSRMSTYYSTDAVLEFDVTGLVFRPLVDNITILHILREHLHLPEINVVGDDKLGITSILLGDFNSSFWDSDTAQNYKRSYSHLNIGRLLATSVDFGLRIVPLTLPTGPISNYYHNIDYVWLRNVQHGIVFDLCPTGNNQTTRTHINTYNHNGGRVALACLNVETLIVDSFHVENFHNASTIFTGIPSGCGIYIPETGDGQQLRNHRIFIKGSTEDVLSPYHCFASACSIQVYPVTYDLSGGIAGITSNGFSVGTSMPASGDLNSFFFLYETCKSAIVGQNTSLNLPDGLTQFYGNIMWIPCSNVMADEGLQMLTGHYPVLGQWVRKVKVINKGAATFGTWVRVDSMDGAPALRKTFVPAGVDANTLWDAAKEITYAPIYTTDNGASLNSPSGGQWYGVIKWMPSNNSEGVQVAYGTYPALTCVRRKTNVGWSAWKTLTES